MYFRDRFRTAINVLGDAFGAGIVNHLSCDELQKLDNSVKPETSGTVSDRNPGFTETNALLNNNAQYKNYSGISNDGFIERESNT